jgi:hypothetical protein
MPFVFLFIVSAVFTIILALLDRFGAKSRPGRYVVLSGLEFLEGRCCPAADVWTGGAGDGLWSSAKNWSAGVPTAGADVQFNAGGGTSVDNINLGGSLNSLTLGGFTGTLSLQNSLSVKTMTQSSGFIDGGPLVVTGSDTWSGGQIGDGNTSDVFAINPGATMTINNNGGLNLRLQGTQLVNGGSMYWQGATGIVLSKGAIIDNKGSFYGQPTSNNIISSDGTGSFVNEAGAKLVVNDPSLYLLNMTDEGGQITANANATLGNAVSTNTFQGTSFHIPTNGTVVTLGANKNNWTGVTEDGAGLLLMTNGTLNTQNVSLSNFTLQAGDVEIGNGTTLNVNGVMTVKSDGTLGTTTRGGTLMVSRTGQLVFGSGDKQTSTPIGFNLTNMGIVTFNGGVGGWVFSPGLTITNSGTMSFYSNNDAINTVQPGLLDFINNGTINVNIPNQSDGSIGVATIGTNVQFSNNAILNLQSGELLVQGDLNQNGAGASTNLLPPPNSPPGTSAGLLEVDGTFTVGQGTQLTGIGTVNVNTLVNNGLVAPGSPGASPPYGALQIFGLNGVPNTGNYTQGTNGSLQIGINGLPGQTSNYDQLIVTGQASLAGSLNLVVAPGFTVPAGTVYNGLNAFMTWGSLNGTQNAFGTTPAGWTTTYGPTGLQETKN